MSDVVLDRPNVNGQPPASPGIAPDAAQEGSNFDIVQILWRWKWLPILGSIVGACLGFLYFSRLPEIFEAAAMVQVVNSIPAPVKNPFFDTREGLNRIDESMVIRSQAVLKRAVKIGRLTEQADFIGMTADDIVADLKSEKSTLVIEPADKDDQTTLIRIAYVSEDAEVAAKVVQAVVDGYETYLADEYKTVGDDIAQLIENAHADLGKRVKDLNKATMEFRANNPDILFREDVATDPYAETFLALTQELNQVRSKKSELESVAKQAKQSLASGRSPESIFHLLAQNGSVVGDPNSQYNSRILGMQEPDVNLRMDMPSSRLEREILFPLERKLRVWSDNLGESHPSVATVKKEVEMVQRQVAEMRKTEKRLEEETDRIQKEFQEETGVEIKSVQERLAARLDAIDEQVGVLQLKEADLEKRAVTQQQMSRELQGMLAEHRVLMADTEAVNTLLTAYTEKLQEIDLMPKMGQRTLKRLDMPSMGWHFGPSLPKYLLGGAAVGFILLSGLAVLMDLADRSYRNPSEISTDLNVSVLGHIPVMNLSKVKKSVEAVDPAVCAIHHSKGRVAEAYRAVRTGLYFSNKGKALKVIQITSPVPGDGKSTLSSNISVTMAQSGRRVLLIDADLRRPRVAKIFGIDSEVGVAAVVSGKVEVEDAICVGPVANLSILPGGKRPANPAEILSSERFKNMVDMLRDKFDIIVIDTPPLLAVSDPGAVAGIVDGVLMTMRLRRNVKPLALRAKSILESVGANLLGVVINGVSSEAGYGYNYDYNDYRYAYKYGSNYRSGYGYRYGYGNYRYGYSEYSDQQDLSISTNQEA
ncbi:MAG: polysaccharide biosynthesis tyrosine autokinase [Aureliella sp.]